jgi:hypothetical protein
VTEMTTYLAAPTVNGDKPLPRRGGHKGLLPSTWLERTLRVEYLAADGRGRETTATLLDLYPFGPILSIAGAKTALSWDALRVVELVED